MEKLLQHIHDSSKKESEFPQLKKDLEGTLEKIVEKYSNQINLALKNLDPSKHSLGYLYLLVAKYIADEIDTDFILNTEQLFYKFDKKQIKYALQRFSFLIQKYTEVCVKNGFTKRGMRAILAGLNRLEQNPESLTPFHPNYLLLCLKSINFKAGLNLLKNTISDIDQNKTGVEPRDMLLYYYYGGMIYIGVKDFQKAEYFFDVCLTVPSYALNAIMVEAYKKFVLVHLLNYGQFKGLNKNCSSIVSKHMKQFCNEYSEFVLAFEQSDMKKLDEILKKHEKVYKTDKNYGLIKQCMTALARNNILKLTDTYLTLSLTDLAKATNVKSSQEAEKILLRMIENGEIKAVIDQEKGMVSFKEDTIEFNSFEAKVILDQQINNGIKLFNRIKNIDNEIELSNNYLTKVLGIKEDLFDTSMMMGKMGKMRDIYY